MERGGGGGGGRNRRKRGKMKWDRRRKGKRRGIRRGRRRNRLDSLPERIGNTKEQLVAVQQSPSYSRDKQEG